jgi:hypothetical protein
VKTNEKLNQKLHLLAQQPLLVFRAEIRVPQKGFHLQAANPLFRSGHFVSFNKPVAFKPN